MPICFVITGYGIKKDYINNRDIDLDKTFRHIIKPVFEELGYECKRSSDYPPGIIDTIMYQGIYNADFVIADVSTLNPNALYELGVRHALRPYSTLVICEDSILLNNRLPFDLSHLTALAYRHDGKSLDIDEVDRFKKILKDAITGMIKANKVDSPVFTHIEGLEILIKQKDIAPQSATTAHAASAVQSGPTLSEMIDEAVAAMKSKRFSEAINRFSELLKLKPDEPFIIQQLCLATYKSPAKDAPKDEVIEAFKKGYKILEKLTPLTSTDTETLGMAGSVHKTLFRLTNDKTYLEKSLRFYERGYYIANDYYNGINTAFLYWKLASLAITKDETMFYKMQAAHITKNVVEICNNLKHRDDYVKRNDKEWITNTLAEAYYGLDDMSHFNELLQERQKEQTDFSEDSYMNQFGELKEIKEKVAEILKDPV